VGYQQRGIPVVGEFCVIHEGDYARRHPADYAEHAAHLSAEEEKEVTCLRPCRARHGCAAPETSEAT
jgi:hypothetical protein